MKAIKKKSARNLQQHADIRRALATLTAAIEKRRAAQAAEVDAEKNRQTAECLEADAENILNALMSAASLLRFRCDGTFVRITDDGCIEVTADTVADLTA